MVESSRNNSENVDNFEENCYTDYLHNEEEEEEEAEGFDFSGGIHWLYPINYPVREYQKNIVANALFKNTLVCLPTGLGKTFIAAVVMYNYHKWYPSHKIVFMAHSKPLVAQQVNACCNIMRLSSSKIAELNGNMTHSVRKKQWESKDVFFLTPQVFNNDLARGNVKAESIRCIVIDEAHKALGNQAYCQVIRSIKPFNSNFRVLALSATPGDDMNTVKEVIQNLMISHLELRSEDDPDIKPYLHEKKIETVILKLDQQILDIKEMFLKAVDKYIKPLVRHKLLPQSFSAINPFSLVLKQRKFMQNPNVRSELRGLLLSNFSVAISLFHALEELTIHGMRSFLAKLKNLQTEEGTTNKAHYRRIANDDDIKSLIDYVSNIFASDNIISLDGNVSLTKLLDEIDSIETSSNVVYSHPKFVALEKIIQEHFNVHKESTRVIVFCKSRQCTGEICHFLARFRPVVKPMIFIGQSQSSGGIVTKGFNQAAQLTVMKRFREGIYNTLVATCVAEEGLDIGEVDLIINFDSGKNSNTQVQRSGRTGRKRDGRVVNLVTEGREHQNYNISVSKGKKMNKRLAIDSINLPFYSKGPRLIPKRFTPTCLEFDFSLFTMTEEEPKEKKRKSKGTKKKLQQSEENHGGKRMRESKEDGCSSWTVIPDGKCKNKEGGVGEMNLNENDINVDDDRLNGGPSNNESEIVDANDEPKILLYNDDVEGGFDDSWEHDDELDKEEWNLIKEFVQENNTMLKPKNNFRDLINLKKLCRYCKLSVGSNTDLISKMKMLGIYVLDDYGKECLSDDKLDVETLEAYFNKSRRKLFVKEVNLPFMKEENSPFKDIVFDVDPDDFFNPFEEICPDVVSSTPMRSHKEISAPRAKNSPLAESNFQHWDESDFFDVKENFSPKRDTSDRVGRGGASPKKKDSSLISITQALDIVNKAESNKSALRKEEIERKREILDSPSSPILFFSQKPKTRNKFIPNSPILTQSNGESRTSRKCLVFSDGENKNQSSKEVPKFKFEDADNSDLFAETEVALGNHLVELEENLNEIEKKPKRRESPVVCLTIHDSSSENTEEYDLGRVNLEENSALATFLKAGNKSDVAIPTLEKTGNKENISPGEKKSNVSNCKGETIEEIGLSRLGFSSFLTNSITENRETPIMESTPVRTRPKMAIVRPLGFENTNVSDGLVSNERKIVSKTVLKEEQQSFTCDFSLFGDDDFDVEKFEKNNEERKSTEENLGKLSGEEDGTSNDSDVFVNKSTKSNIKCNPCPSPKGNVGFDVENLMDDCDLSEEAIEAIKAVEMYEKNAKTTRNQPLRDFDSDDSDDFFVPARRQCKQLDITDDEPKTKLNKSGNKKKCKNKVNYQVNPPASEFVEREADVSRDGKVSSDEENTSGLDEYDSSFVDESELLIESHEVDMTAKYLQSTKSPMCVRPGTFKIPKSKVHEHLNVFSQMGSEGESEYENDSFCVSEEESHTEMNEISELELAEVILREKKKRKRVKDESVSSVRKKNVKRVMRIESDSSDDDVVEVAAEPTTASVEESRKSPEIQELFNSSFPTETGSRIAGNGTPKQPIRETIFVSSRQVAMAPEIATFLRAKWNVNVQVRSSPEADFIVSWRVGINRISLSDFSSISANAKNSINEMIEKLSMNFNQPVLVVEDDKNRGLPLTTGCRKVMWVRHSMKTLAKVLQKNVKILFSRSKEETAAIVVNLCKKEMRQGHSIHVSDEPRRGMEKKIEFYSSLPGVNVANAFRIAQEYSSLSSFMMRCDSVGLIMKELGLKKEPATLVYQLLFAASS